MYSGEAQGQEDSQQLTGSKAVSMSSQVVVTQHLRGRFHSGMREAIESPDMPQHTREISEDELVQHSKDCG